VSNLVKIEAEFVVAEETEFAFAIESVKGALVGARLQVNKGGRSGKNSL
jgi:hypothetical protein